MTDVLTDAERQAIRVRANARSDRSHGPWDQRQTTHHELLFLHEIARYGGIWPRPDRRPRPSTIDTLRGYLAGARYRSDWGEIDPAIVLPFVRRLITYLEAKALVPEMEELLRELGGGC